MLFEDRGTGQRVGRKFVVPLAGRLLARRFRGEMGASGVFIDRAGLFGGHVRAGVLTGLV